MCRYVNLEVCGLHGYTRNVSLPQNVLRFCCLTVVFGVHTHTHTHRHTDIHAHRVFFYLSPFSLFSLSLCLYTYSHSAGRQHMYLRNVKPLKFTVKAATSPTASPKGFEEHMFLTYVFSEAFKLWEGTGCNLGAQIPPKLCSLFFCWGRGMGIEVTYFFLCQGFFFFPWHPKRTHMTLILKIMLLLLSFNKFVKAAMAESHIRLEMSAMILAPKSALFIGSFSVDLCRVS